MPQFWKDGDWGGFKPVADQDHNLILHSNLSVLYRRVDYRGPIAPFQCIDLGALAAAAIGAQTQIVRLEMPDNELAQIRWYVEDNAQIYMSLPGIALSQLRNLQAPYDMNTPLRDPNLVSTELHIWEDNRPNVRAVNGMSGYALTAIRIIAAGWRFHTFDLESPPSGVDIYTCKGQKTTGPELVKLIKAGLEPATHLWVSGRGQGD